MPTTASDVVAEPVSQALSAHPDQVAADVARQEVVEEGRDQVRQGERAERRRETLGAQQQVPPPDADKQHQHVQDHGAGERRRIAVADAVEGRRQVGGGQQVREEREADRDLDRQE